MLHAKALPEGGHRLHKRLHVAGAALAEHGCTVRARQAKLGHVNLLELHDAALGVQQPDVYVTEGHREVEHGAVHGVDGLLDAAGL